MNVGSRSAWIVCTWLEHEDLNSCWIRNAQAYQALFGLPSLICQCSAKGVYYKSHLLTLKLCTRKVRSPWFLHGLCAVFTSQLIGPGSKWFKHSLAQTGFTRLITRLLVQKKTGDAPSVIHWSGKNDEEACQVVCNTGFLLDLNVIGWNTHHKEALKHCTPRELGNISRAHHRSIQVRRGQNQPCI